MANVEAVYLVSVFHLTFRLQALIKFNVECFNLLLFATIILKKTGARKLSFCFKSILKLSNLHKLHQSWFLKRKGK